MIANDLYDAADRVSRLDFLIVKRGTEVATMRFSHLALVAGIQVRPNELPEFTHGPRPLL
jgi:hypothetical protein